MLGQACVRMLCTYPEQVQMASCTCSSPTHISTTLACLLDHQALLAQVTKEAVALGMLACNGADPLPYTTAEPALLQCLATLGAGLSRWFRETGQAIRTHLDQLGSCLPGSIAPLSLHTYEVYATASAAVVCSIPVYTQGDM